MNIAKKLLIGALAVSALPIMAAQAQQYTPSGQMQSDRPLTSQELNDLIARSRSQGVQTGDYDVSYLGGSRVVDTVECCENVQEQVTEQLDVQETTTYVDAVTEREIIQPVQRTMIQPIERRIVQGRTETVTDPVQYQEERLPVMVQQDPVPQVRENIIPQQTTETREEVIETYYDAVTQRDVIQPIERVTVVPVERRIMRPRVETVTADTRYETITAPLQVEAEPMPQVREYVTEQLTTDTRPEYTETYVDVVTQRDVIQPVERTIVQPIERRILRGTTETVTAPVQYREERLPVRVETEPAPQMIENVIPQITERTVFEVSDVYVDQVTRNVIQPVVVTTVQPIEYRRINGRKETVTNPVRYEEEYLPGRVEADPIPETVVNYIPQVNTQTREEVIETYFDAVTQRDVIQPIVTTMIQPVEYRRVRGRTETVTAPVQYETVRGASIVINVGTGCACAGGTGYYR